LAAFSCGLPLSCTWCLRRS